MSEARINVLIVDDSKVVQQLLKGILSAAPGINVVGIAADPYEAREKIKTLNPDVITLDVEMPKMDGITFLRNLMRLRPMPVLMISTLTQKGADITLEALELGAVDYVAKPTFDLEHNVKKIASEIIHKVKVAARANLECFASEGERVRASRQAAKLRRPEPNGKIKLLAIGASTGGTEAIKQVLLGLPQKIPPVVVVQHMPAGFTDSFARRLNSLVDLTVVEFNQPKQVLEQNHVYIANGSRHLQVSFHNGVLYGLSNDSAPVNRHKPAVDVLFNSAAEQLGPAAIGVLLTGMGLDGASGLGKMKREGALTIAQDEKTSIVWGMPRVAIEEGAAVNVLPLGEIGAFLAEQCYK